MGTGLVGNIRRSSYGREDSEDAIKREILEETGLDVNGAKGGFLFSYHREDPSEGDNYFVDVYRFEMDFTDSDIKLQRCRDKRFYDNRCK